MCGEKGKMKKRLWTVEEDIRLLRYIKLHGDRRWSTLAKAAGLQRSGRSCRLRWVNHLRPGLKRTNITPKEEQIIIDLVGCWGNRWSQIAKMIPGRTDNEIKNHCRTHLRMKLQNFAQTQNIGDPNCSPQGKQVMLPRQSLEVFTGDAGKASLSDESNHGMFNTETPMDKFSIEEVIRDIKKVRVQVEGSIQNDMGVAGNGAVEFSAIPYSYLLGIPVESYATQVFEASCSTNPDLMYPTLDWESDVMLWNV